METWSRDKNDEKIFKGEEAGRGAYIERMRE
jgi:hypothetical protein